VCSSDLAAGTGHLRFRYLNFGVIPAQNGIGMSLSNRTIIGGTADGEGNVITASRIGTAIILGQGAVDTVIQGNLIGTNASGTARASTEIGIEVVGGSGTLIGGTEPGAGNVIAASRFGISMTSQSDATIQGNFIGTDATGTSVFGSTTAGIFVNHAGANGLIGGTDPAAANKIANHRNGIVLRLADTVSILGNEIFSNTVLGIDLGQNGVTLNDADDSDTGPNGLQNFPVLGLASLNGSNLNLRGSLSSIPNMTFRLEFFANTLADPSGFGEGERYLGSTTVITDGTGNVSFDVSLAAPSSAGELITATATDPAGNTSEFSAFLEAVPGFIPVDIDIKPDRKSVV